VQPPRSDPLGDPIRVARQQKEQHQDECADYRRHEAQQRAARTGEAEEQAKAGQDQRDHVDRAGVQEQHGGAFSDSPRRRATLDHQPPAHVVPRNHRLLARFQQSHVLGQQLLRAAALGVRVVPLQGQGAHPTLGVRNRLADHRHTLLDRHDRGDAWLRQRRLVIDGGQCRPASTRHP
jgi:hypothetical protein